jgi:hypothetical protein
VACLGSLPWAVIHQARQNHQELLCIGDRDLNLVIVQRYGLDGFTQRQQPPARPFSSKGPVNFLLWYQGSALCEAVLGQRRQHLHVESQSGHQDFFLPDIAEGQNNLSTGRVNAWVNPESKKSCSRHNRLDSGLKHGHSSYLRCDEMGGLGRETSYKLRAIIVQSM